MLSLVVMSVVLLTVITVASFVTIESRMSAAHQARLELLGPDGTAGGVSGVVQVTGLMGAIFIACLHFPCTAVRHLTLLAPG